MTALSHFRRYTLHLADLFKMFSFVITPSLQEKFLKNNGVIMEYAKIELGCKRSLRKLESSIRVLEAYPRTKLSKLLKCFLTLCTEPKASTSFFMTLSHKFAFSGKHGFVYQSLKSLQEESNAQEVKEQLEALTAHVDYVQENITDCQTSIMEMEVCVIEICVTSYVQREKCA